MGAQGSRQTVRVATDLASAERLIDAAKFAVAFVDIGLDISDDGNVDGVGDGEDPGRRPRHHLS